MTKQNQISISTYHEYILEAIYSLRLGLDLYKQAKLIPSEIGSDQSKLIAEISCRYAFLMTANSIEAAANALLLSLNLDKINYEELEKTATLNKFKTFCSFLGKRLDQGDVKYARVKDIISCRNEFVHPKPRKINYYIEDNDSIRYDIQITKNRNYPNYYSEIKCTHALTAVEDTLNFLSWVCFDICELELQDGAMRLGFGSYGSTGDIDIIGIEKMISFDKRTFGKPNL